jgi:hypothetical protein
MDLHAKVIAFCAYLRATHHLHSYNSTKKVGRSGTTTDKMPSTRQNNLRHSGSPNKTILSLKQPAPRGVVEEIDRKLVSNHLEIHETGSAPMGRRTCVETVG